MDTGIIVSAEVGDIFGPNSDNPTGPHFRKFHIPFETSSNLEPGVAILPAGCLLNTDEAVEVEVRKPTDTIGQTLLQVSGVFCGRPNCLQRTLCPVGRDFRMPEGVELDDEDLDD